jgi:hypothetical protein
MSIEANEYSLADLFMAFKKEVFGSLNCHHVGIVQSFNAEEQTCQATIAYKKTCYKDTESGVQEEYYVDYPILIDAPAIVLSGGGANLTFPISQGDECLCIFNDRDIDYWFASGQVKENETMRMHSYTDGFILVGMKSLAKKMANYDTTHAQLSWGQAKLGITDSKVLVSNTTSTLNDLLQELITEVKNLATQCAAIQVTGVTPNLPVYVSGPPQNASDISAISGELEATASKIAALLE